MEQIRMKHLGEDDLSGAQCVEEMYSWLTDSVKSYP